MSNSKRAVQLAAAVLFLSVLVLWLAVPRGETPPQNVASVGSEVGGVSVASAVVPGFRDRPTLTQAEELDREIHTSPPSLVRLRWLEHSVPGSVRRLSGSSLALEIENGSTETARIDLSLTIDAGTGMADVHRLAPVTVGAKQRETVSIDLARFVDIDSMQFAGRFHASARAVLGEIAHAESSLALFFHREPQGAKRLMLYDADALRSRFGAGDFRGLLNIPSDETAVTDRVVAARISHIDPANPLLVTDDDAPSAQTNNTKDTNHHD